MGPRPRLSRLKNKGKHAAINTCYSAKINAGYLEGFLAGSFKGNFSLCQLSGGKVRIGEGGKTQE